MIRVEFDSYLDTRELADGVYKLLADFDVYVHTEETTTRINIKPGFITDLASVPRIPFAYLMFGGIGNYAAVAHDGLYSKCSLVSVTDFDTGKPFKVTRKWADDVFYYGLLERGIDEIKATPMYLAVRVKGGKYYKRGE